MKIPGHIISIAILLVTVAAVYLPFSSSPAIDQVIYPADTLFYRGISLLATDSLDIAEYYLRESIRLQPLFAPPHFFLAEVYAEQNKFQRALQEYEIATKLDPEYYVAYYHLAKLHHRIGEIRVAMKLLELATNLNPSYRTAYEMRLQLYIEDGDFVAAQRMQMILDSLYDLRP